MTKEVPYILIISLRYFVKCVFDARQEVLLESARLLHWLSMQTAVLWLSWAGGKSAWTQWYCLTTIL